MQVLGAAEPEPGEIVPFEDVEHLQHGDALTIRRQLEHAPAAIGRRDGVHPLGAVRREVRGPQVAALPHDALLDSHGNRPGVERIAAVRGEALIDRTEPRVCEGVAGRRRAASRHESRREARIARQRAPSRGPVIGDHGAYGKTGVRVVDRRRKQVRERQPAETPVQLEPTVDRARHAHCQRAVGGDGRETCAREMLRRETERRPAAGVETRQRALLGIPNDRKQVATDAAARRLHEPERGIGRNGRVHRRAAAAQRLDTDLRS